MQIQLVEITTEAEALEAAARLAREQPDAQFVAVVSADPGAEARQIFHALWPGLAEIVCFDAESESGADFAMRALEEFGFGEDFVFTVARLEDAIDYALRADDWEGSYVVVAGPPAVIERARRHLN
jgi:hypothetical protein